MKKSVVFVCVVLASLVMSTAAFGQSRHRHTHHAATAAVPGGDLCRHLAQVLRALTDVGEEDLRERVARALAARCPAAREGQRGPGMDDNITGLSPNRPDGGPVPPPPCQDRPVPPPPPPPREGSAQCPNLYAIGLDDGTMGPDDQTIQQRLRIRAANHCPPPPPEGSELCPSVTLPGLRDNNMGPSAETIAERRRIRARNNCLPPPPLPRGNEPPI